MDYTLPSSPVPSSSLPVFRPGTCKLAMLEFRFGVADGYERTGVQFFVIACCENELGGWAQYGC